MPKYKANDWSQDQSYIVLKGQGDGGKDLYLVNGNWATGDGGWSADLMGQLNSGYQGVSRVSAGDIDFSDMSGMDGKTAVGTRYDAERWRSEEDGNLFVTDKPPNVSRYETYKDEGLSLSAFAPLFLVGGPVFSAMGLSLSGLGNWVSSTMNEWLGSVSGLVQGGTEAAMTGVGEMAAEAAAAEAAASAASPALQSATSAMSGGTGQGIIQSATGIATDPMSVVQGGNASWGVNPATQSVTADPSVFGGPGSPVTTNVMADATALAPTQNVGMTASGADALYSGATGSATGGGIIDNLLKFGKENPALTSGLMQVGGGLLKGIGDRANSQELMDKKVSAEKELLSQRTAEQIALEQARRAAIQGGSYFDANLGVRPGGRVLTRPDGTPVYNNNGLIGSRL